MTTKNKVPQIRFKGFSEEWNSLGFDETFSNISNNNLSRAELNYEFGRGRNVHYGDILIRFSEILDVEKAIIPYITNDEYVNKFKNSKLQNGDIIIADAAEDDTVGKCTEVVNIKDEIVFSGLHTIAVRPTKEFASKYLGYYINSSSYHNQLLPLLQGTKVLSISKSAIKNTDIDFPQDILEQTKIGDYFQQLDKLIEQKEKKYQKLKHFKKAMLDKMFPKNGADVPEIRFKGFNGKWEEKSLGDIANITIGEFVIKTKQNHNSPYPVYNGGKSYTGFYDEFNNDGNKIIISARGANAGYVNFETRKYWAGNSCYSIDFLDKNLYYIEFFYHYIKKNENKFTDYQQAANIPSVSKADAQKFIVHFPKIEEQEKIGNYFQKLDNQIDLQQKELEKLKNIKKASLSKMFV